MKRFKVRVIAAALALSAFAFTTGFARASEYAAGTAGYLKSATYYSDDRGRIPSHTTPIRGINWTV